MIAATVNAMTAMMEVPTGFRRDVLGADRADPSLCSPAPDEEFPASPLSQVTPSRRSYYSSQVG